MLEACHVVNLAVYSKLLFANGSPQLAKSGPLTSCLALGQFQNTHIRDRSQTLVRGGPDAKNIYRKNFSGPPSDRKKISGPPFLP